MTKSPADVLKVVPSAPGHVGELSDGGLALGDATVDEEASNGVDETAELEGDGELEGDRDGVGVGEDELEDTRDEVSRELDGVEVVVGDGDGDGDGVGLELLFELDELRDEPKRDELDELEEPLDELILLEVEDEAPDERLEDRLDGVGLGEDLVGRGVDEHELTVSVLVEVVGRVTTTVFCRVTGVPLEVTVTVAAG
jgi:hypothetical protein